MSSRFTFNAVLLSISLSLPVVGQHAATRNSSEPAPEVNRLNRLTDEGKKVQTGKKLFPTKADPPEFEEALRAFVERRYDDAVIKFRQAWKKDPQNLQIAKGLMYAQLRSIKPQPSEESARQLVSEFTEIVQHFPDDPDLNVGLGMALAYAGDPADALDALNRGETLGADLEKAVGRESLRQIYRQAAAQKQQQLTDEKTKRWRSVAVTLVDGLLILFAVMFVTRLVLGIRTPKKPGNFK